MTNSGVDARVVRLERRIRPSADLSRLTDDELRAEMVKLCLADPAGPAATIRVTRAMAEAGDDQAIEALAAWREALA